MKKILFAISFLLFITHDFAQESVKKNNIDIVNKKTISLYYKNIFEAEKHVVDADYEKASGLYQKAFTFKKKPLPEILIMHYWQNYIQIRIA